MPHLLRPGICLLGALLPLTAGAVSATSLGSFEGIEEPLVRYAPATGAFRPDPFVNITAVGQGTFRMFVRYRADEWDADRDTPNTDRQRAEVKGLGVHQFDGETFEYASTWRTSPGFAVAGRFCHLFQLKSTDGDSGAPLVTVSIEPGEGKADVRYWSGHETGPTNAREFAWQPGVWITVRVRIKTSRQGDGEVLVSVNGDEFRGARGIDLYRPEASEYRPKWGLYRGVRPGLPYADAWVEHKDVSAARAGDAADDGAAELLRRLASASPATALATLTAQPATAARAEAAGTIAAQWAEREPATAMAAVEKLAPDFGRASALLRVFNRWTDRDPAAALRWAAARAPAAELDTLLWYFATDTTRRYVARDQALAGAALIAEPGLRYRAVEHIVLIWARREPDAAAAWTRATPALDAAQQTALVARIRAVQVRRS